MRTMSTEGVSPVAREARAADLHHASTSGISDELLWGDLREARVRQPRCAQPPAVGVEKGCPGGPRSPRPSSSTRPLGAARALRRRRGGARASGAVVVALARDRLGVPTYRYSGRVGLRITASGWKRPSATSARGRRAPALSGAPRTSPADVAACTATRARRLNFVERAPPRRRLRDAELDRAAERELLVNAGDRASPCRRGARAVDLDLDHRLRLRPRAAIRSIGTRHECA